MYLPLGTDLSATHPYVAPKHRPTLREYVQAYTERRGNSPLWGADYESWPNGDRHWTDFANGHLHLPQCGPPPCFAVAVGDATERD